MAYLGLGILLGLAAGISPGPLMALLMRETLRGGRRAGLAVATVPAFTDLPVIALLIFVFSHLPTLILHALSVAGGLLLLWMSYQGLHKGTEQSEENQQTEPAAGAFRRGLMVNALNPHMYVFWALVGVPLILRIGERSLWFTLIFVVSFLVALVGLKAALVLGLERGRRFLLSRGYDRVLKLVHLALGGLGLYLIYSGVFG